LAKGGGLGRNLAIGLAGQCMVFVQGIVVVPVVIRLSGVSTYGAYVLLLSMFTLLFSVLGWLPYRYQRNLVSAHGAAERRALFEPQFTFQVLVVAVVSGAVLALHHDLEWWFFEGTMQFSALLLILFLIGRLLNRQVTNYFQFTQRFVGITIATTSVSYIFVALLIVVVLGGYGISLDTLLLLNIASVVPPTIPLAIQMVREIGVPRLRLPPDELLADLRVGLPLVGEVVLDFLMTFSDRYLIATFLSVAAVGQYQPAYVLGTMVLFPLSSFEGVLMPTLSRALDVGERPRAEDIVRVLVRLSLMLSVPMAVGALMTGPSLIALLANREIAVASRWAVPLIAVSAVFLGVQRVASLVAFVLGRTRTILVGTLTGAIAKTAVCLVFLPMVPDLSVPAAAALVGYAACCVYILWVLRPAWRIAVEWGAVLRYGVASVAMGGALWLLEYRPGEISNAGPAGLAVGIVAGVVIYFMALAALGGIGRQDLRHLGQLLKTRVDRGAANLASPS